MKIDAKRIEFAITKEGYWKTPEIKSVGLFTDLNLYYDALKFGSSIGFINFKNLQSELSSRIVGIKYIKELKSRAFNDLLKELNAFGFIKPTSRTAKLENTIWELTDAGFGLVKLYESNKKKYFRLLAEKMHIVYTIPGWFVSKLWDANPQGKGQIIIPSPPRDWNPISKLWDDNLWNEELEKAVIKSIEICNSSIPNSFPFPNELWIDQVKNEYERLGTLNKRKLKKNTSQDQKKQKAVKSFAPRRRLASAMRTVAVTLFFSNINVMSKKKDFQKGFEALQERAFMAWCPRLEALEFIFYSDSYKDIPGRVICPLGSFKNGKENNFENFESIKNPENNYLSLFQPKWETYKLKFLEILFSVYQSIHNKERILYAPLQDVRDEVCRISRISATLFDNFLEEAFKSTLMKEINFSIALETDIREDQRSYFQQQRRPVYVQSIPHSLIAIKQLIDE